jgi:hypothetical protein
LFFLSGLLCEQPVSAPSLLELCLSLCLTLSPPRVPSTNLLWKKLVVLSLLLVGLVLGALPKLLLRDLCGSPIRLIGFFFWVLS